MKPTHDFRLNGNNTRITKHGYGVAILTETKKKGTGTEITNKYVHIFTGVPKHERAKRDCQ